METKEEELLFKKWIEKRPEMAKDGIVNRTHYLNNSIKVLYILKEVNDWKKGDLREFIKNGARWRTWNNIARWQNGIEKYVETGKLDFKNKITKNNRKEILKSIAVLNLKIESGGATSNMKQIWHHAKEDIELLKEQVRLYNPDITICCGTGDIVSHLNLVENADKFKTSTYGISYSKNQDKLIIKYWHPQARIKKRILFDKLLNSISEITIK